MKKLKFFLSISLLFFLLAACSSSDSGSSKDMDHGDGEAGAPAEDPAFGRDDYEYENDGGSKEPGNGNSSSDDVDVSEVNRKIIYTASLYLEVKDYDSAMNEITDLVNQSGGYLVNSSTTETGSENERFGEVTVRVPQEEFQDFIALLEEGSSKILESSISGQDVTEEYVDLESRLKSKRVVEERLLSFMEKAEKTDELLLISQDLAKVQEEIEVIVGRMNYLKNRSDLATITIYISENNVVISSLNDEKLNTWELTKEQFKKSINFLMNALSYLVIFLIGNLPIFILLGVIGAITYFVIKKRLNKKDDIL